ncbi:ectin isoform X1 [Drosophila mauritiana]|uniref:Ectin isoform X1 n=1 Tax=Drosophila mauritiana TaxID=7226 RepID=A0A6P8JTC9_DROMA|nr:ectin isoform X1 [Drosophila mauritiana]
MLLFLLLLAFRPCLGYNVIRSEMYEAHNSHRRTWLVPELIESDDLSKDAEEYAIHLSTLNIPDQILYETAVDRNLRVDHLDYPLSEPDNEFYTENICEFIRNECIYYWATEGAKSYAIEKERRTEVEQSLADKFSAITWKSTREMGVGWAPKDRSKRGGRKILVVRYNPAGNQPGEFEKNIEEPKFLEYFEMPTREDPDRWRNGSARLRYGLVDVQICIYLFLLIIPFIRKA